VTGPLRDRLADYLALRRALGYRLARPEKLLNQFLDHLDRAGKSRVTVAVALDWARLLPTAAQTGGPTGCRRCAASPPTCTRSTRCTRCPPRTCCRSDRFGPARTLYSDADIAALIAATRALRTPLRRATFATLIGTLAVTGIRVGEAIALDRGDVDLASGRLVVRHGKFDKARELTLHPTTVTALRRYQRLRDRSAPATGTAAFFVSLAGTRLIYCNVHHAFHRLVHLAGLTPGQRRAGPASTTCGTPSRSGRCSTPTPTPPARTGRPG